MELLRLPQLEVFLKLLSNTYLLHYKIANIFKIQISTATPSSSIPSGGQIITTKDPKTGKSIQQLVQTVTDPKTGKSTQVKVPLPNGTQQGIIMMKSCLAQFNSFDGRSDHQQDTKNRVSKVHFFKTCLKRNEIR